MQPYHFDDWNSDAQDKDEGSRNGRNSKPPRSDLDQRDGGEAAEHRERRQHEHEMTNAVVHRWPQRDRDHERQ